MVMGKVSKAIAASFLCLSLFNASGDFASAMKSSKTSESKGPDKTPGDEDGNKALDDKDKDKTPDDDEDKTPDEKKGLPEWAIRTLIGVGSGVGGMVLGVTGYKLFF